MRVLHITPHLGGGVGKAHSALARHLEGWAEQTYVLLEKPLDERYIVSMADSNVVVTRHGEYEIADLIDWADLIQIEWWENPRLRSFLANWTRPDKPVILWSHQSKIVPPDMAAVVDCLIGSASVCGEGHTINSGFGFEGVEPKTEYGTRIGYFGTVDFKKLNPLFFDVINHIDPPIGPVIWGKRGPGVLDAAYNSIDNAVEWGGHTDDPESALRVIDIFFYPLQPNHYGTGENALIEAMSVGCCPVVLNNPVEAAIVEDGVTGFVCNDANDCAESIKYLQAHPNEIRRMGQAAARYVAEHKTTAQSAQQLLDLWADAISQPHEPHGTVAPLPVLGAD